MFPPVFPIYIQMLARLYRYAPLIWLTGVSCLWLTRYTHQLGERWGSAYYALSAVVRPAGVILIGLGWLALYAPETAPPGLARTGWLPGGNWSDALCWVAIWVFFALGVWAVATLGLRRSFLFRRVDDDLITHGPYAIVRHPQFLSAIGVTFFGTRLFNPAAFPFALYQASYYHSLGVNWALFTLALWLVSILEDRELAAHFGKRHAEYAKRVPRLFPI